MYRFDWSVPSRQPVPGAFLALELALAKSLVQELIENREPVE